ncbi:LAQU0S04e07756g1_1 [Lachancea quebecensis]|uniref:LAQU0S04e07756g1_1 n=1 Tax=Lachancea quebecensis TaxID=1654605 RepID=A0A0P1KQX8_9SACH|nr:LAQU0S04e07756g1_1 [Lachancea quebecensis]
MNSRASLCFKRLASSTSLKRPPFHEVFPQKRLVNRLLFELDSKLTFPKLYPVYESIYNNLGRSDQENVIPNSFAASDVMIMKKVLEKLRHRTKSTNKNFIALENELMEKAAEMGDNDAIGLLAYNVLKNPQKNSPEDVAHAKTLIKQLYQMNHPLTLKLTGDFAWASNDFKSAENYYKRFLEFENDTFRAGEVYGQLGVLYFKKPNLKEAERCFLASISLAPRENVVKSYYHLAQLYMESNPLKARSLMESAAGEGFKESFQLLGFLEMNYFKNYGKSQQWFRLGMELYEIDCYIGYFDSCVKMQKWHLAKKCMETMRLLAQKNVSHYPAYEAFLKSREDKIKALVLHSPNPRVEVNKYAAQTTSSPATKENSWGL